MAEGSNPSRVKVAPADASPPPPISGDVMSVLEMSASDRALLEADDGSQAGVIKSHKTASAAADGNSKPKSRRESEATERLTCRQKTWRLMDDPSSSTWAQAVATMVMVTIGVSTLAFVIETLPQFHRKNEAFWETLEAVCIGFFTIEFLARVVSTPDLGKFAKSILNIVDLVAIAPFYIELIFSGDSSGSAVFRVIRLVRVFRVFKISRYLSWVKIFASALVLSAWPLGMLVFVMAIGTIVFSSLIFYTERGDWDETLGAYYRSNGEKSPYQSIPASFWWCIVTMTTVGYGDHVPITTAGRIIAAVTSLLGILVLAIPITVISANFNQEYMKLKKKRESMRARMMLLKNLHQQRRSGLDAMYDEIDEIIRRNAQEFRKEVDSLFDQSKDELAEELKEVTRMAYQQRQQERLQEATRGPLENGSVRSGQSRAGGSPGPGNSYRLSSRQGSGSVGSPAGDGEQALPPEMVFGHSDDDGSLPGPPARLLSDGSRRSTGSVPARPSPLNPTRGPLRGSSRTVSRTGAGSSRSSFPGSGHELEATRPSLASITASEVSQSSARIHPTSYGMNEPDGIAHAASTRSKEAKASLSDLRPVATGKPPLTSQMSLPGCSDTP